MNVRLLSVSAVALVAVVIAVRCSSTSSPHDALLPHDAEGEEPERTASVNESPSAEERTSLIAEPQATAAPLPEGSPRESSPSEGPQPVDSGAPDPARMLVKELEVFREDPSLTNAHFVVMRSIRWILDDAGTSIDITDLADNPLASSPLLETTSEDDKKFITFTNTGSDGMKLYKVDTSEFPAFTRVHELCFTNADLGQHVDADLKVLIEHLAQDAMFVRRR